MPSKLLFLPLFLLLVRETGALLNRPLASSGLRSTTSLFAKPIKVSDWAQNLEDGTMIKDGAVLSADDVRAEAAAAASAATVPKKAQKMELFVKAGPEGTDIGDCPFAQYNRMVLAAKGVSYTTTPCTADTKSDWLVESYEGKMPCLLHEGEARVESEDISLCMYDSAFPRSGSLNSTNLTQRTRFTSLLRSLARSTTDLNFFFSSPQLRPATDATDAATAGFFPALAKFLKNKDKAADAALQEDLEAKLATLDAHLASVAEETAGDDAAPLFMAGGGSIGLADCALAPKLFHLRAAAAHYKTPPFSVDPVTYPALARYMAGIFEHPAFLESAVPDETVIWGWGNARGD